MALLKTPSLPVLATLPLLLVKCNNCSPLSFLPHIFSGKARCPGSAHLAPCTHHSQTFTAAAKTPPVLSATTQPVLLLGKELGKAEVVSSFWDSPAREGDSPRGATLPDGPHASLPRIQAQWGCRGHSSGESPPVGKPWGATTPDSQVCVKQAVLATPESLPKRKGPASLCSLSLT